jgi:hypothetical protein
MRVFVTAGALLLFLFPVTSPAGPTSEGTKTAVPDTGMTLKGDTEGTVFKDLVVEGEDLIRIEFDRPELQINIDPHTAPGLEWGSIEEVLDRNEADRISPFLQVSACEHSPYTARPWLDIFATGEIIRFRPQVEDVDRWKLLIANSRGQTVASFEGRGKPPREIGWNGLSQDGTLMTPGLTYSYVLEAYDQAGNKRSFVGEGFELPAYRQETSGGLTMLFSGREIATRASSSQAGASTKPPILLEVASRINQSPQAGEPVRVEVTARSFEKAKALADGVVQVINPLILGGPARIQPLTNVEPDGPVDGAVEVTVPR